MVHLIIQPTDTALTRPHVKYPQIKQYYPQVLQGWGLNGEIVSVEIPGKCKPRILSIGSKDNCSFGTDHVLLGVAKQLSLTAPA